MRWLTLAARAYTVRSDRSRCQCDVDAPLSANRMVSGEMVTIGHRQYQPTPPVDGHFVSSQTAEGRTDTGRFLLQALAGQTPVIGQ